MTSEYDKRAAISVALRAERTPMETVEFLKLPKSLVYRVKKNYDAAENQKDFCPSRKKHARRSDTETYHETWLTMNVLFHWSPDLWPPSYPDCNSLDYYV